MRRILAIAAFIAAAVLVIAAIPFMVMTMRTPAADCGTVFSSPDSWTYKSRRSDPSTFFNGTTNLDRSTELAVADLMDDLDRGSAAASACGDLHHDRKVLLFTLGGMAATLLIAAIALIFYGRRRETVAPEPA